MSSKSTLFRKPRQSLCLSARLAHRLDVNIEVCSMRCASGCVKKAVGAGVYVSEVQRV